jgi:hypothetical protein
VFTVSSLFRLRVSQYLDHATFPVPSTSQRNVRISRIARPHLLHAKAYETYPAGTTFGPSRRTL